MFGIKENLNFLWLVYPNNRRFNLHENCDSSSIYKSVLIYLYTQLCGISYNLTWIYFFCVLKHVNMLEMNTEKCTSWKIWFYVERIVNKIKFNYFNEITNKNGTCVIKLLIVHVTGCELQGLKNKLLWYFFTSVNLRINNEWNRNLYFIKFLIHSMEILFRIEYVKIESQLYCQWFIISVKIQVKWIISNWWKLRSWWTRISIISFW